MKYIKEDMGYIVVPGCVVRWLHKWHTLIEEYYSIIVSLRMHVRSFAHAHMN